MRMFKKPLSAGLHLFAALEPGAGATYLHRKAVGGYWSVFICLTLSKTPNIGISAALNFLLKRPDISVFFDMFRCLRRLAPYLEIEWGGGYAQASARHRRPSTITTVTTVTSVTESEEQRDLDQRQAHTGAQAQRSSSTKHRDTQAQQHQTISRGTALQGATC